MPHGWPCSGRITGQAGACEEGKGECMKYMRFMGQQEYEALMRGEELENHTDWKAARKNSDSVGFCFFDTLEAPEERLRQGYGTYAKPVDITRIDQIDRTLNHQNRLRKKEYSIEHYSNRTMVPIRTGKLEVYGRPWKRELKILWEDEKRKDEGEWKQEA